MQSIHRLKIIPDYFQSVINLEKSFEVRENDRDFQVGDLVNFMECCNEHYTGREALVQISYVLSEFSGIKQDYVVFFFRLLSIKNI